MSLSRFFALESGPVFAPAPRVRFSVAGLGPAQLLWICRIVTEIHLRYVFILAVAEDQAAQRMLSQAALPWAPLRPQKRNSHPTPPRQEVANEPIDAAICADQRCQEQAVVLRRPRARQQGGPPRRAYQKPITQHALAHPRSWESNA